MATLTAATIQLIARELYGCEIDERAAQTAADAMGDFAPLLVLQLPVPPEQVQPPFSYAALEADAARIAARKG